MGSFDPHSQISMDDSDRLLLNQSLCPFWSIPEISDPMAVTDDEIMDLYLRSCSAWSAREGDQLGDLPRLRPEQLPGSFVTSRVLSDRETGWETDHGRWVPKKVCTVGGMRGVKTTMEFKPNKGTKANIGQMALFNSLVPFGDGLRMDESSTLCCVYPKGKGSAPHPCRGFVDPPLCEWKEELCNFDLTKDWPIGVEDYGVGGRSNKRKRGAGSELWEGYTKIYTSDPDRLYAACNHCATMLKLKANSGTGSHSHHNKSCPFKKLLIGSSMNTPPSALEASAFRG